MINAKTVGTAYGKSIVAALVAFGICFTAAGIGTLAVNQTLQSWYVELRKPAWNPPNWLFGPVWTLLYAAMAISLVLVWNKRGVNPGAVRRALVWFGVQLILNTAWSWIFFACRLPGWAFAEMVVLWASIVFTIVTSWRVSRLAAILLMPYLVWVTFAGSLNATIWRLNS